MTTNWSNVFDHIQDFDLFGPDADKWNEWYSKFKIHAMVSGFFDLADEEKVDVLLLKLKNFSALDIDIDGDPIAFEELLLKLGKHCTVTNFRQMFLNRRQLPGESFNDFAQGLQQLSLPCRFTDELIVRDVFISNMHKSHAVIANILGSLPDNPTLSETALLANYLLDDTRDPGYVVKQSALIFNLSGFQHRFWRHGKDSGDSAHTKHDKPDFRNDPHTISKQPALGAIRKGTTRYSDSGSTTTEFSETTSKASKNANRVGKYDSQATSQRHLIGAPPFPLGEYHTVGVIHVISKDRVRVCPKEAISEFKELYNSLDTYYNEESHQRPLRTFKVGMTCVTNHEGVWHRARIDSIVSDNTTKLQLWDYGSEITVNNSNVLFIPKHFYTAPKHTFDICIGVAVKVGDMFEIALDQFKNEVWLSHLKNTCESSVEVAQIKQNPDDSEPQERDDDVSPEPVPLNQYIEVLVIYRKPEGVLCVILKSKLAEVNKINVEVDNWFSEPGNQIVLKKRDKGAKCASLFNCSWYRAQITEVDTPSNSVKVYYYDFGNEELITDLTRLMVLPPKLAKMPVHLFQITPLSPVGDEYLLEVKLVGKESNGSWSAVVKGMEDEASSKMIAPDLTVTEPTTVGSDVGNPAHQYGVSSDNESASTMSVKIVNKSLTDGTLFAVLNHQLSDLQQMTNELLNAEKSPLIRPDIGVLCLAPYRKDGVDEWRRAEITQVNRTRTKVRVDFIDSGDKDQLMISQLRILPDKFQTLPPFAFEIEVPGRQIELGAALKVKPVSDDEGPLVVELEDCNNNGLVSRPSPPIPKDGLTEVQVIYHGSEGVFATRVDRLKQAAQMAAMIQEVAMTPLQSPPITGEVYLAPFDGVYYRAKVLSVNPSDCHMFYIDYGNQTDVQSEELRQLPPELATNIHEPLAIKLTVSNTKAVEDGCTLKVKPVFREDIGSWEIMMEDELSSGDDKYRLPDVSSAPTVPSHSNLPVYQPPTVRRLPKNTYSEVSVVYVGPEGTFAVCVNEISKMVNITEEVAALERIPLPLPPAVGEMCIAPYEGCYYRARIRSVLEESFCVEFVDYGNTDLVAPGQLMEIPLAYAQEIFTFKIEPVDGRSLSVGFEARVKPISVRSDGTTVVELAEDSNA